MSTRTRRLMRAMLIGALSYILWGVTGVRGADDYVKIGSWNIQNLGERQWGQHPKALAEHIGLAGIDLLALQEIHDTDGDASRRTNAKLDQVMALLNQRDGQRWTYVLFAKRFPGDTVQLTGVAWNRARLSQVGVPYKIKVVYTSAKMWHRQPHAMKFATRNLQTDFVVIPVHMLSNRNGKQSARHRQLEARALARQLDTIRTHFGDRDVIVLGDTNCLQADEKALQTLRAAGFKDLNAADRSTYRNKVAPFDRILVPREEPEFRYSRQYVLTPSDTMAHVRRLSDHYLVLTTVRILPDDD